MPARGSRPWCGTLVRLPLLCARLSAAFRVRALALAAVTFVVLAAPARAYATAFDPAGEDWEGLSQLVRMAREELGPQRVVVTSTLDLAQLKREDALLLVHPERNLDPDELTSFMRAGGRVVLLDDYGTGDELLARFDIRRVPMPSRPAEMLRGNPSFAIAEPASDHIVVRDVGRVVTNHATGLDHPALSAVLVVRGDGEPDVLVGVAGAVGRGRLLAIGDASIPMNDMMRYPGNRALAASLVRYATEDDVWGARNGKLYVLTNDFETVGSFRYAEDGKAGALGEVRRAVVDALETLRREGMPPLAAYLVALAVGLGVVVWTSARAGKTHKPAAPRFVRRVPVSSQGGVAGRAAVIAAPNTSRVLAVLELKSALEEELATRLGLERVPAHDELVARLRRAELLDAAHAQALTELLARLARMETMLVMRRRGAADRVRDGEVLAIAARVREVLGALGRAPAGT